MVHKIFLDSRAAVEGDASEFTWQPERPIMVPKCRAFIDAVHMPVTWGTITQTNRYVYVAEEAPFLTVFDTATKVYFREAGQELIATLSPAMYDGPNLAAQLQSERNQAGTATYTCVWSSPLGGLGQIAVGSSTAIEFVTRKQLLGLSSFAGQILTPSNLQDASDVLGLTEATAAVLVLGSGLAYRRVELSSGTYTFDQLATEMQDKLNQGLVLDNTYAVTANATTGRLSITNPSTLKFYLYATQFLDKNPYAFQGYSAPFFHSDDVTGFTGRNRIVGNTVEAESHVNTMAYHSLFINSTLGTHNDTIGPLSQTTIARKVVIDQPQGGMVHDFHSLPYDYLSLEAQSITALRFRVTDWRGQTVSMSHWSLSILFVPEEQF